MIDGFIPEEEEEKIPTLFLLPVRLELLMRSEKLEKQKICHFTLKFTNTHVVFIHIPAKPVLLRPKFHIEKFPSSQTQ